uniref:Uncharacterized protein n=1 Tax=Amphimedon queenslandica TaxID=400682 RepID=A0A1X7VRM5_AMPQE
CLYIILFILNLKQNLMILEKGNTHTQGHT